MGVPSEIVCPYDDKVFAYRPGPEVDRDAFDRRGELRVNYFPIIDVDAALINAIERVLTSGRGVAFGISVSEAFCATLPSGIVKAPGQNDKIAGGHCLTIVGHNRAERWFLVKNSWSAAWSEPGQPNGCCRFSYDYVANLASDCWFCGLATGGAR